MKEIFSLSPLELAAAVVAQSPAHVLLALGDLLEEDILSDVDYVQAVIVFSASNCSAVTTIGRILKQVYEKSLY